MLDTNGTIQKKHALLNGKYYKVANQAFYDAGFSNQLILEAESCRVYKMRLEIEKKDGKLIRGYVNHVLIDDIKLPFLFYTNKTKKGIPLSRTTILPGEISKFRALPISWSRLNAKPPVKPQPSCIKIKLSTVIEIPKDLIDDFPLGKEEQAKQNIRDAITDFAKLNHVKRALEYALSNQSNEAKREEFWADLCSKLEWNMSVVERE